MSFFSDILSSVKAKSAEMKERKEFLDMVEEQAKPIRRAAYMKQMLNEVVAEGIEKAKQDSAKKLEKKKTPQSFGIGQPLDWSHLDSMTKNKSKEKK